MERKKIIKGFSNKTHYSKIYIRQISWQFVKYEVTNKVFKAASCIIYVEVNLLRVLFNKTTKPI